MGVIVPYLVVFTLKFLYRLGKNNFLSMIFLLIKIFFHCISDSSMILAEKAIKAVKV